MNCLLNDDDDDDNDDNDSDGDIGGDDDGDGDDGDDGYCNIDRRGQCEGGGHTGKLATSGSAGEFSLRRPRWFLVMMMMMMMMMMMRRRRWAAALISSRAHLYSPYSISY